ncbi:SDR family NAD(P)-dependent oxidoreductase [Agrobacterium rhizogenes]|nr:SDR family NAD(P)-dependent oxidoreductase [Rhizobium rhizogenes]
MALSRAYLGGAKAPTCLKEFYFLRHGATDLNEVEAIMDGEKHWGVQGSGTDIGLNPKGKRQARLAGNALRRLPVKHILCSPLRRALQTLWLANISVSDLEIDPNLGERNFGRHEGGVGPVKMFRENFPDCENTEHFSDRVAKALIHACHEGVLFVSHGGVLLVIAALLGVELTKEQRGNARALHFKFDGLSWNVQTYESGVVLISGATGGIGRAIVENLMGRGFRLSLGARSMEKLQATYGTQNESLHYALFEAQDPKTMEEWVPAAATRFGRIDALVNNAGDGTPVALANEIDFEMIEKQLKINAGAPLRMIALCLPHLAKTGSGRIVNINSMSGQRVLNSFVGYNMSKHALTGITKTTQHVGWEYGIRAMEICPGFVATKMSAYTDQIDDAEKIQPEDIGQLVRQAIERPNNAFVAKIEVVCMKEAMR